MTETRAPASLLDWPGLWRAPILLLGVLSLVAGIAGGLARLGWGLAPLPPGAAAHHGPLMVVGFLSTLIGLERAVALGRRWAYLAPIATGLGGVHLAAGGPVYASAAQVTVGAAIFCAGLAVAMRVHPSRWSATHLAAGVALLVGSALWLAGWPVPRVVPWWAAFLILTIAAERLELSRLLRPTRSAIALFAALVGLTLAGALVHGVDPEIGARLSGSGWLGLALWLGRWDLARRSIRRPGLGGFLARSILGGHAWLAIAGVFALALGGPMAGPRYDAILHSVFLGFAFSMVFGHAPVIFPGVLRVRIRYAPRFYAHLALLHAGLLIRVAGDLTGGEETRAWGGLLNALAILVFFVQTATSFERAV